MISKGYCERATMIDSEIICDNGLSLEALGLYNFLVWVSNIHPQEISLDEILKSRDLNLHQNHQILKELEKRGYIDLPSKKNDMKLRVYNSSTRQRRHLGE